MMKTVLAVTLKQSFLCLDECFCRKCLLFNDEYDFDRKCPLFVVEEIFIL